MSNIDWSVTELPEVSKAVGIAARKLAGEFEGIVEREDLVQDGLLLCASNAGDVLAYVEREEGGLLSHWVWCRLFNAVETQAARSNRSLPYDVIAAVELDGNG